MYKAFPSLLFYTVSVLGNVNNISIPFLLAGSLVQQNGKKMPYVKITELGIIMEGLPVALGQEIGVVPRKRVLVVTVNSELSNLFFCIMLNWWMNGWMLLSTYSSVGFRLIWFCVKQPFKMPCNCCEVLIRLNLSQTGAV